MPELQNNDDELIKLYGEFIMRFETVCSHLRFTIHELLFDQPIAQQFRKVEVLLEGLAADALRKKAMALIVEEYGQDSDFIKGIKGAYKEFEMITPLRNSFAHGTPLLNTFTLFKQYDDGLLTLRHPKLKVTGLDFNSTTYDSEKLKQLVTKMQYIGNCAELTLYIIKARKNNNPDKEQVFFELLKRNVENARIIQG